MFSHVSLLTVSSCHNFDDYNFVRYYFDDKDDTNIYSNDYDKYFDHDCDNSVTVNDHNRDFICQAFMVEETKRDIYNKVSSIENRVESNI